MHLQLWTGNSNVSFINFGVFRAIWLWSFKLKCLFRIPENSVIVLRNLIELLVGRPYRISFKFLPLLVNDKDFNATAMRYHGMTNFSLMWEGNFPDLICLFFKHILLLLPLVEVAIDIYFLGTGSPFAVDRLCGINMQSEIIVSPWEIFEGIIIFGDLFNCVNKELQPVLKMIFVLFQFFNLFKDRQLFYVLGKITVATFMLHSAKFGFSLWTSPSLCLNLLSKLITLVDIHQYYQSVKDFYLKNNKLKIIYIII